MFDNEGKVIGVAASIVQDGQNLNFAVPISYAYPLIQSTGGFPLAELKQRLAAPQPH